MEQSVKKQFDSLQLLRGIAAIAVVFFHGFENFALFGFGKYGVDLFFVLSGFIMLYIHRVDLGEKGAIKPFLMKRFIRIYPTYWIVTLAYIALISIFGFSFSSNYILKSMFLLPQGQMPIVGVAWTLEYEVLFYLMFALFMLSKKWFYPLLGLWSSAILISWILSWELSPFVGRLLDPLNLEFVCGCMIAYLVMDKRLTMRGIVLIGVIVLGISVALQQFILLEIHRTILWGIPFALIIYGLVSIEIGRSIRIPKLFVRLGDASYSIYLTHLLTLLVLESILERVGMYKSGPTAWMQVILCIISIIIGVIFYYSAEKRMLSLFRRKAIMGKRVSIPSEQKQAPIVP